MSKKNSLLAVENERQLAANVIRSVEAEKAGGKIESGAVGALDHTETSVAVVRLRSLVSQT